MKIRIIYFIIIFIISGCEKIIEKEKIVEIEKEYSWKSHDGFKYENVIQLNSSASNERLSFIGANCYSEMRINSTGDTYLEHNTFNSPGIDIKLPICKDYFISYSSNLGAIYFYPTGYPFEAKGFDFKKIDSTFLRFNSLHAALGQCIAINNQNQSLIPYYDKDFNLKFTLIDIELDAKIDYYIDTIKTKKISITDEYQRNLYLIESIEDVFFISTSSKSYRIDSHGDILKILDERIAKVFELNGVYYGLGYKKLYHSLNKGLTWSNVSEIEPVMTSINYANINREIIGYRNSQLWHITSDNTIMTIKELVNDGLEGNLITSVSEFNSKIYVSTLSGVYFKAADSLFEYKPETE